MRVVRAGVEVLEQIADKEVWVVGEMEVVRAVEGLDARSEDGGLSAEDDTVRFPSMRAVVDGEVGIEAIFEAAGDVVSFVYFSRPRTLGGSAAGVHTYSCKASLGVVGVRGADFEERDCEGPGVFGVVVWTEEERAADGVGGMW